MKLKPFIHLLQSPYHCYIFTIINKTVGLKVQ